MHVALRVKAAGKVVLGILAVKSSPYPAILRDVPLALFAALGLTSLPQAMTMTLCLRDFALQMTRRRLHRILISIRHIKHKQI